MTHNYRTLEKGFCEKLDEDGECIALLVHSAWKGERTQKWLFATNFDSIGQMWGEAREIMRQMLEDQNKPDTLRKIRCTTIDGGIYKQKKGDYVCWVASWRNKDGKTETANFSISKYGERTAKRKARQARDQAVRYFYGFHPERFR